MSKGQKLIQVDAKRIMKQIFIADKFVHICKETEKKKWQVDEWNQLVW